MIKNDSRNYLTRSMLATRRKEKKSVSERVDGENVPAKEFAYIDPCWYGTIKKIKCD